MSNPIGNWIARLKDRREQTQQIGAVIRVVGDRYSGKTAYLCALVRQPNHDPSQSAVKSVTAKNDDGKELIAFAQNILEQGDALQPTPLNANVNDVKDYSIEIVLTEKFRWRDSQVQLNLSCKDYAGEFFKDLINNPVDPLRISLLNDYIDDCVHAGGILLLMDGLSHKQDALYANALQRFLEKLDHAGGGQRNIAFVITKCEQPELWVNKHKPKIVAKRFKECFATLERWKSRKGGEFECFTTSAFGTLGDIYEEPNMKPITRNNSGLVASVLKNPKQWRPFGLVAPIYWLCTGQHHPLLDKE